MTCDDRKDLILLDALDALEGEERAALHAHLSTGCPRCTGAVAEARAVTARIALAADPVEPPPAARVELMQRVRMGIPRTSLSVTDRATARASRPSRLRGIALAIAASFIGALIGGAAIWSMLRDEARLPGAEEVQYVALEPGIPQPFARGRIHWDTVRHRWHVYAYDLKPLSGGRTYAVWLVTADQKHVAGGRFGVDAGGSGAVVIDLPQDIGPLASAVITDEPAGLLVSPSGPILLAATVR